MYMVCSPSPTPRGVGLCGQAHFWAPSTETQEVFLRVNDWIAFPRGRGWGGSGEALPKSGGTFVVGSLWTSAPKVPSGDSVILKGRQDLAALGQQLS